MDFEIADKFWKYSESFLTKCLNYDILKPVQSCCFLRATFPWVFFHQSSKEEMIGFSAKTCTALQTQQPSYGILFSALSNLRPDQQSLATTSLLSTLDYLDDRREIRTTTYLMKVYRLIYLFWQRKTENLRDITFHPSVTVVPWLLVGSCGPPYLGNQNWTIKNQEQKKTTQNLPISDLPATVVPWLFAGLLAVVTWGRRGFPHHHCLPPYLGDLELKNSKKKRKTS